VKRLHKAWARAESGAAGYWKHPLPEIAAPEKICKQGLTIPALRLNTLMKAFDPTAVHE
jgi:hypothetical protein